MQSTVVMYLCTGPHGEHFSGVGLLRNLTPPPQMTGYDRPVVLSGGQVGPFAGGSRVISQSLSQDDLVVNRHYTREMWWCNLLLPLLTTIQGLFPRAIEWKGTGHFQGQ